MIPDVAKILRKTPRARVMSRAHHKKEPFLTSKIHNTSSTTLKN
jgi:hypothetical protein